MQTFTAFTKRAENLLEQLKLGLPGAMLVHTVTACAANTQKETSVDFTTKTNNRV